MCNGDGIEYEQQLDADYWRVEKCPGCPACNEDLAGQIAAQEAEAQLAQMHEDMPLWAGLEVYDTPRRGVRSQESGVRIKRSA
jgi:hypothetical protein